MKNIKTNIGAVLLSISLFTTSTNAGISTAKKISLGEEAPFSGVIVPAEEFQFIDSELAACTYIQSHPQPCDNETDLKGMLTVGVFSFSLGLLASLLVKK